MTTTQRNLLYALGIGTAAFVGYKMFFAADDGGASDDPTGNGGIGDANTGPGSPTGAFNAAYVATSLYNAMKDSGTNESAILNILKHVNPTQFVLVVKAFGRRSYNSTFGNQINYFPVSPLPLEPLQVWLESELSEDEYETLRLKYPYQL